MAAKELGNYKRILEELEPVVEGLKRLITLLGLPASYSHTLAIMYVTREQLMIDELSQLTGYARTTLFTCTNTLGRLGLVNKRKVCWKYAYAPLFKPSRAIMSRFHEVLEKCKATNKDLEEIHRGGLKSDNEDRARKILEDLTEIEKVPSKMVSK
ncbi:MAG: hypothetical protein B6U76_03080 [Desulfurococcales archaeon ex4484_217_2]|nr:MAG: hypothetical protein B6U76_03080 [Desulfurococcales archaeon ex4484_217_2]